SFIRITKGREYPTTNPKIWVTHVSSLDCFRKTERHFSELCRSHLFICFGSSSPSIKIKAVLDLSLITNHHLFSPSPCSCAISSLTITEVDEQICFGNWRDRHDRARRSEATFRKGHICACGSARSSQSEKTIWLEHCT